MGTKCILHSFVPSTPISGENNFLDADIVALPSGT
jgi:hypothetical protein